MEFQGLASGDPNIDAHPVRYMAQEGIPFMLAQSFDSVGSLPYIFFFVRRLNSFPSSGYGTVYRFTKHIVDRSP